MASHYSSAILEIRDLINGAADQPSATAAVALYLGQCPRCSASPAMVAVAFTMVLGEPLTVAQIADLLVTGNAVDREADLDLLECRVALAQHMDSVPCIGVHDFNVFKALSTAQFDPTSLEQLLASVVGASALFPLSRWVLACYNAVAAEEAAQWDDDITAEVAATTGVVVQLLADYIYGRSDADLLATINAISPSQPPFIQSMMAYVLGATYEVPTPPDHVVDPEEVEFLGRVAASLTRDGHDFEAVMQAIMINAAEEVARHDGGYQERLELTDPAVAEYNRPRPEQVVFQTYLDAYSLGLAAITSLEGLITWVRVQIDEHLTILFAPAVMLMDAASKVQTALHSVFMQVAGFFMDAADTFDFFDPATRSTVGFILYTLANLVDIKHRNNPKSVWAMLTSRKGARLSRSELFLLQLGTFSHKPSPSYDAWADDMIRGLARSGVDASQLRVTPPARAVYYPRNTFGPADNNDLETAVDVHFHETVRETRRVQQALARGAPRGIDSAWLASAANVQASIDRYVVPRPVISPESKQLLRDAADAVFEHHRELYDRPQPMSVAAAMLATEWKYSAGLPFIPVIKTRQALKAGSMYRAIAFRANEILESGEFPDVAFHAFPKADVVPRDKVIADGSAIRSVTAGDRVTAIVANTLLGEVNKRVAPMEAWVANQLPRREGGLQEMYRALSQRPCIVTTDGWRFDSQVPAEVMSIGSTRLYERGIEGWWGARAATTFVEAYYQAVAHGLVVNLMDGEVTRKTGGGGTGSAFTSSDNRNWVKIVFVAAFSLAFDRPPRAFFDHVTLAHASDDVIFSCDEWLRDNLSAWQDVIFTEFGLRFDFERQDNVDGFLHLRLVPEGMLDPDAYERLGLQVPEFAVMHDPARLATKRSDYRSDRMRHSYLMAADHVATQCFGHMLLTAHVPDSYHDIATEAMEATSEYLGYFFKDVDFTVFKSERGLTNAFDYRVGADPGPGLLRDCARRFADPHGHEALMWKQSRMATARKWIKCHRYPSYLEVFKAWVTPEDWERLRPAQKKWSKLVSNVHVNVPGIDLVQAGMLALADVTARIPTGLTRWSGPDLSGVTRPIVTNSFMVELFVYHKFKENNDGRAPSYGEFQVKCREAPYGSVTDPNGFWMARTQWDFESDPRNEKDMGVLQGRMLLFTLFYGIVDFLQSYLRMNRIAGFIVGVFFLLVRDLDKWYSLLHLAYWLHYGEASVTISNMSPRDPFIAQKILALLITACVPLVLFRWLGNVTRGITSTLAQVSRMFYHGYKVGIATANTVNIALAAPGDRWAEAITQMLRPARDERVTKIVAGMGSGKSTSLVRSILDTGRWTRVVVIVPTRSLVENYINPFVAADQILRVVNRSDLDQLAGATVVVITAHRFLGLSIPVDERIHTLLLYDEAHMSTTAQMVSYFTSPPMRTLFVSGTPGGLLWESLDGATYTLPAPPGPSRVISTFESEPPLVINDRQSAVHWVRQLIDTHGTHVALSRGNARFAVYHPSTDVCASIRVVLERSQYEAHLTAGSSAHISRTGVVVGTYSIVTGVNFDPPIHAMIDTGLQVRIEPRWVDIDAGAGGLADGFRNAALAQRVGWSSPATRDQVAARTARTQDGFVWRHPASGSGPDTPQYPDTLILLQYGQQTVATGWDVNVLRAVGVESELVMNPDRVGFHPLRRYIHFGTHQANVLLHADLLEVCILLATVLASVNQAVAVMQDPSQASSEEQDALSMIAETVFTPGARPLSTRPPPGFLAMTRYVGFHVRVGARSVPFLGRPVVAYPGTYRRDDNTIGPRPWLLSVSGLYARSQRFV